MVISTTILGTIGTFIIIAAYVPQIMHIVKEHCSGGVSSKAWAFWLLGTVLILIHALSTGEAIFIALQIVNFTAIILTLILIYYFRAGVCHSKESIFGQKHEKKKN